MTTEKKLGLNVIVWSKDRPLQLHLCLETLVKNFKEAKDSTISVVYRATSDRNTKAYDALRLEWSKVELAGGPKINFIYDTNFYLMTSMAFGYHEQTMFVVDDQIFCRPFSVEDEVFKLHRTTPERYFTVSLRLDKTKTYCYPLDQKQALPSFITDNDNMLCWAWNKAQLDWGYIVSLDGNIYHTNPIRALIMRMQPQQVQNPNALEMLLNGAAQQGSIIYPPQILAYQQAKTVSVPANKVQTTFNNRSEDVFSVEMLFEKWNEGLKIDAEDAINKVIDSNSPHTPIEYVFIPR